MFLQEQFNSIQKLFEDKAITFMLLLISNIFYQMCDWHEPFHETLVANRVRVIAIDAIQTALTIPCCCMLWKLILREEEVVGLRF